MMEITELLDYLPHRYPFVMIDRVLDLVPDKTIRALKNLTFNEHFFPGHFPEQPIMPGVLILEALAQASGTLAVKTMEARDNKIYKGEVFYFAGIDQVRFKQPVVPGDQLILQADLVKQKRLVWKFDCRASVDGNDACKCELTIVKRDNSDT
jgi:3-hydroxyacyl-[acyl-carrier-protein] dehydratase